MKERQCVESVLSGNPSAFVYFVDLYQDMAVTLAYRVTKNMQDAEDIAQESFIKAFRNLHTFRKESKFSTWFYRIVLNTAIAHTNLKVWSIDMESDIIMKNLPSSDFNVIQEIEAKETQIIISKIIDKLPTSYGVMLTLFYLDNLSIKDINEITSLSISNIKVLLFRARNMFKDLLIKNYPEILHKYYDRE